MQTNQQLADIPHTLCLLLRSLSHKYLSNLCLMNNGIDIYIIEIKYSQYVMYKTADLLNFLAKTPH